MRIEEGAAGDGRFRLNLSSGKVVLRERADCLHREGGNVDLRKSLGLTQLLRLFAIIAGTGIRFNMGCDAIANKKRRPGGQAVSAGSETRAERGVSAGSETRAERERDPHSSAVSGFGAVGERR